MKDISTKLKHLRMQKGLTLNALAVRAGIATSFLSKIEKGEASPTIVSLKKILGALNKDLEEFFSNKTKNNNKTVYKSSEMSVISDEDKRWVFAFPKSPNIKAQLSYEEFYPHTKKIELETHPGDICGYVLEGELTIEIKSEDEYKVRKGEAFYVKSGKLHGAKNTIDKTAKLICVRIL